MSSRTRRRYDPDREATAIVTAAAEALCSESAADRATTTRHLNDVLRKLLTTPDEAGQLAVLSYLAFTAATAAALTPSKETDR